MPALCHCERLDMELKRSENFAGSPSVQNISVNRQIWSVWGQSPQATDHTHMEGERKSTFLGETLIFLSGLIFYFDHCATTCEAISHDRKLPAAGSVQTQYFMLNTASNEISAGSWSPFRTTRPVEKGILSVISLLAAQRGQHLNDLLSGRELAQVS